MRPNNLYRPNDSATGWQDHQYRESESHDEDTLCANSYTDGDINSIRSRSPGSFHQSEGSSAGTMGMSGYSSCENSTSSHT